MREFFCKNYQLSVALLCLLALSACGFGRSSSNLSGVQVALADIGFEQAGLLEQTINLDLRFTNPNPVALSADGLRFDMTLAEQDFAQGVSSNPLQIPALGEITVPVSLRVSTTDLIDTLIGISSGEPIQYSFDGDLFLAGQSAALPFDGNAAIRLPDIQRLMERFGGAAN